MPWGVATGGQLGTPASPQEDRDGGSRPGVKIASEGPQPTDLGDRRLGGSSAPMESHSFLLVLTPRNPFPLSPPTS